MADPITYVRDIPKTKQCAICRRSKATFPGIKLIDDYVVKSGFDRGRPDERVLRGVLCTVCKKGIDAFPERSLMFQAINYMGGGI
jgi:hypothetical protein